MRTWRWQKLGAAQGCVEQPGLPELWITAKTLDVPRILGRRESFVKEATAAPRGPRRRSSLGLQGPEHPGVRILSTRWSPAEALWARRSSRRLPSEWALLGAGAGLWLALG